MSMFRLTTTALVGSNLFGLALADWPYFFPQDPTVAPPNSTTEDFTLNPAHDENAMRLPVKSVDPTGGPSDRWTPTYERLEDIPVYRTNHKLEKLWRSDDSHQQTVWDDIRAGKLCGEEREAPCPFSAHSLGLTEPTIGLLRRAVLFESLTDYQVRMKGHHSAAQKVLTACQDRTSKPCELAGMLSYTANWVEALPSKEDESYIVMGEHMFSLPTSMLCEATTPWAEMFTAPWWKDDDIYLPDGYTCSVVRDCVIKDVTYEWMSLTPPEESSTTTTEEPSTPAPAVDFHDWYNGATTYATPTTKAPVASTSSTTTLKPILIGGGSGHDSVPHDNGPYDGPYEGPYYGPHDTGNLNTGALNVGADVVGADVVVADDKDAGDSATGLQAPTEAPVYDHGATEEVSADEVLPAPKAGFEHKTIIIILGTVCAVGWLLCIIGSSVGLIVQQQKQQEALANRQRSSVIATPPPAARRAQHPRREQGIGHDEELYVV